MTGEEIRRMREDSGMGMAEFASFAGVSEATLYRLETDRRAPRPSTVRKIERAFERMSRGSSAASAVDPRAITLMQLWADLDDERRACLLDTARLMLVGFVRAHERALAGA